MGIDPHDDEHCVVDVIDENEWYVEFSATTVTFGNAEEGTEVGTLSPAAEFIAGNFAALRRRPWA